MGYNLLLLWVWCTIILSLRNICSTLILPQPLLSLSWWGKAFRYASKNSTARLADGSDVHTSVLAVDEPPCPTFSKDSTARSTDVSDADVGVGSWRTNTVSDFYWYMYGVMGLRREFHYGVTTADEGLRPISPLKLKIPPPCFKQARKLSSLLSCLFD